MSKLTQAQIDAIKAIAEDAYQALFTVDGLETTEQVDAAMAVLREEVERLTDRS